jgi:hypothetical protein
MTQNGRQFCQDGTRVVTQRRPVRPDHMYSACLRPLNPVYWTTCPSFHSSSPSTNISFSSFLFFPLAHFYSNDEGRTVPSPSPLLPPCSPAGHSPPLFLPIEIGNLKFKTRFNWFKWVKMSVKRRDDQHENARNNRYEIDNCFSIACK